MFSKKSLILKNHLKMNSNDALSKASDMWTNILKTAMIPKIISHFCFWVKCAYKAAETKSFPSKEKKTEWIISTVMQWCGRIRGEWGKDMILAKTEEIKKNIKNKKLQDCIDKVLSSHLQIYAILRKANNITTINFKPVADSEFVHKCYIEAGQFIIQQTYLVLTYSDPTKNQENYTILEKKLNSIIDNVIASFLPLDQLDDIKQTPKKHISIKKKSSVKNPKPKPESKSKKSTTKTNKTTTTKTNDSDEKISTSASDETNQDDDEDDEISAEEVSEENGEEEEEEDDGAESSNDSSIATPLNKRKSGNEVVIKNPEFKDISTSAPQISSQSTIVENLKTQTTTAPMLNLGTEIKKTASIQILKEEIKKNPFEQQTPSKKSNPFSMANEKSNLLPPKSTTISSIMETPSKRSLHKDSSSISRQTSSETINRTKLTSAQNSPPNELTNLKRSESISLDFVKETQDDIKEKHSAEMDEIAKFHSIVKNS